MSPGTVLVTGASRGIGLEFTRQYADDGWSVIACCRSPDDAPELRAMVREHSTVSVEALDVTDHAAIDDVAGKLSGTAVDVLINNAGIMGALPFRDNLTRQHFGSLDYQLWDEVFRTNTLGTVKMTEAFTHSVAASNQKKIISLSSVTGSIAEGKREALAYTTSKTALNKAMTVIAERLRPRGVIVALFCPGYVKTRMNVGGATLEVSESVSGMRRLISALTLADSGTFHRYNGDSIAW